MGRPSKSFFEKMQSDKWKDCLKKIYEHEFWRFEYTKRNFLMDMYVAEFNEQKDEKRIHLTEVNLRVLKEKIKKDMRVVRSHFSPIISQLEMIMGEEVGRCLREDMVVSAIAAFQRYKYNNNPRYVYEPSYDLKRFSIEVHGTEGEEYLSALERLHTLTTRYGYFPWVFFEYDDPLLIMNKYEERGLVSWATSKAFLKHDSRKVKEVEANFVYDGKYDFYEEENKQSFYCYLNCLDLKFDLTASVKKCFESYCVFCKRKKALNTVGERSVSDVQIVVRKSLFNKPSWRKLFEQAVRDSIIAYQRYIDPFNFITSIESLESLASNVVEKGKKLDFEPRCVGIWIWDQVVFHGLRPTEAFEAARTIEKFSFRNLIDQRQCELDFKYTKEFIRSESVCK